MSAARASNKRPAEWSTPEMLQRAALIFDSQAALATGSARAAHVETAEALRQRATQLSGPEDPTARQMAHSHVRCAGDSSHDPAGHTAQCDMLTVEFGHLFRQLVELREGAYQEEPETDADGETDTSSNRIFMAKINDLRVHADAARILIKRVADGMPFGKRMARRFLKLERP